MIVLLDNGSVGCIDNAKIGDTVTIVFQDEYGNEYPETGVVVSTLS